MKKTFSIILTTFLLLITVSNSSYCQTKSNTVPEDIERVFTLVKIKPSFTTGADDLNSYLTKNVKLSHSSKNTECTVRFIVSVQGNISDVQYMEGKHSFFEDLRIPLLNSSGKWTCAVQNDYHVNAYCTFSFSSLNKKITAVIQ